MQTSAALRPSVSCHCRVIDFYTCAELTQSFVNDALDAFQYAFALPVGAVITSFTALGACGRVIKALQGETPDLSSAGEPVATLSSRAGVDTFCLSFENIRNLSAITVRISFCFVVFHAGLSADSLRLTFPTFTGFTVPESILPPGFSPNYGASVQQLQLTVSFEMNDAITSISSPTHPTSVSLGRTSPSAQSDHDPTKAYLTLASQADKDVVIDITCQNMDKPRFLREWSLTEGTDALALTFVPRFALPPLPRQEYLFLVEIGNEASSSMNERVRQVFTSALRGLPAQGSTFNLLTYGAHAVSRLWPASVTYSVETVQKALRSIKVTAAASSYSDLLSVIQMIRDSCHSVPKGCPPTAVVIITQAQRTISSTSRILEVISQSITHARTIGHLLRFFTIAVGVNPPSAACEAISRIGQGAAVFTGDSQSVDQPLARLLVAARGAPIQKVKIDWGVKDFDDSSDSDTQHSSYAIDDMSVSSNATILSFYDSERDVVQDHGELGPRSESIGGLPPPAIQQSPDGATRQYTLYPGFRQTILAIAQQSQADRLMAKITGEVLGQPLELMVPLQNPITCLSEDTENTVPPVLHRLAAGALIQDFAQHSDSVLSNSHIQRLARRYDLLSPETIFVAGKGRPGFPSRATSILDLPSPSAVSQLSYQNSPTQYQFSTLVLPYGSSQVPGSSTKVLSVAQELPVCPSPRVRRFACSPEPNLERIPSPPHLKPAGYHISPQYANHSPVILPSIVPPLSEQKIQRANQMLYLTPPPNISWPLPTPPDYATGLQNKSPPGTSPLNHFLNQAPLVFSSQIDAPTGYHSSQSSTSSSDRIFQPSDHPKLSVTYRQPTIVDPARSSCFIPALPHTSSSMSTHSNFQNHRISSPAPSSTVSYPNPTVSPPFPRTHSPDIQSPHSVHLEVSKSTIGTPVANLPSSVGATPYHVHASLPEPARQSPAYSFFSNKSINYERTRYLSSPVLPKSIAFEPILPSGSRDSRHYSPAFLSSVVPPRSPTSLEDMAPEPVDHHLRPPSYDWPKARLSSPPPFSNAPAVYQNRPLTFPRQHTSPLLQSPSSSSARSNSLQHSPFQQSSAVSGVTCFTPSPYTILSPEPVHFISPPCRPLSADTTRTQTQPCSLAVSPYASPRPMGNLINMQGMALLDRLSPIAYSPPPTPDSPPSLSSIDNQIESLKQLLALLQSPAGSFLSTSPLFSLLFSNSSPPNLPRAFIRQLGGSTQAGAVNDIWSTILVLAFIARRGLTCEEVVHRAVDYIDLIVTRDFGLFAEETGPFRQRWQEEAAKLVFASHIVGGS